MRYEFLVTILPGNVKGYNPTAYTEGVLKVWVDGQLFLNAEGVLLVEFAVVLAKWLRDVDRQGPQSLYYASMDFEEEPIFALRYVSERDTFVPSSVWALCDPLEVNLKSAQLAAAQYLEALKAELENRLGIDLYEITQKAIL